MGIRRRGHLRQRGKNTWALKVDVGRDPLTGKRITRWISLNGTKKEVDAQCIRILAELDNGKVVASNKLTYAEYLKVWLVEDSKPRVAKRTFLKYEELIRDRIIPALGHIPLNKLTHAHITHFYAGLRTSGRRDTHTIQVQVVFNVGASRISGAVNTFAKFSVGFPLVVEDTGVNDGAYIIKEISPDRSSVIVDRSVRTQGPVRATLSNGSRGLSERSILSIHRVLLQTLRRAVVRALLSQSPMHAVVGPKLPRRQQNTLTFEEAEMVLDRLRGTRLYIPVLIGLHTGMRRGEILALHWREIDLQKGTLSVSYAVEDLGRGELLLKQPKSDRGRRRLSLPSLLVEELRKHKVAQSEERLRLGSTYEDNDLVVCQRNGRLQNPVCLSSGFHRIMLQLGLKIRFHDLRHTHMTWLLASGVHPKVASERAGHASIGITMDLYSSVMPGMDSEAADKIDQAMREARAKKKTVH